MIQMKLKANIFYKIVEVQISYVSDKDDIIDHLVQDKDELDMKVVSENVDLSE